MQPCSSLSEAMASGDSERRRQRGEVEGISVLESWRPMCDSLLTLYALMAVSIFASLVVVKMANYDFDRDILGGNSVESFLFDFWKWWEYWEFVQSIVK